jgi:hypothetical protein
MFKIVPLPIRIHVVHVVVTTEPIRMDIEPIDTLATNSRVEPFEFLSTSLPLTLP